MKDMYNEAHIWYLFHSGFAVETSRHLLVFDYYSGDFNGRFGNTGNEILNTLDLNEREVLVFSSHNHFDHFDPVIFDFESRADSIKYILSDDIEADKNRKNVLMVKPGSKYVVDDVTIDVYDSTDIGVSFLVSCDGLVIFHAGDLNWWHWKGEPDEDNNAMAENYKKQIDLLKGKHIDIAFIPVDPRLEEYYILGLDYFMTAVGAKMVFPMHWTTDASVFDQLKNDIRTTDYIKQVADINANNRQFVYRG